MSTADIVELISNLLPIVAKYGPDFVHSIVDLIHKNPNATHEELAAQIQANLDTAAANDAAVEQG